MPAVPRHRHASTAARCSALQHMTMQQSVPRRTALLHHAQTLPFGYLLRWCATGGRIEVILTTYYIVEIASYVYIHIYVAGDGVARIFTSDRPHVPRDWPASAWRAAQSLRRDCLRRATAASALALRGTMCATAERAHTDNSVVTDAVFQAPMFALNAFA